MSTLCGLAEAKKTVNKKIFKRNPLKGFLNVNFDIFGTK